MAGPLEQRWFFQAEEMYVTKLWTYDQIIEQIKAHGDAVSRPTLSAWNKKGDWNIKRGRYLKTRTGLAEQINQLIEAKVTKLLTEKSDLTAEDLKELNRLFAAADRFTKDGPDLRVMTTEVFSRFAQYLRESADADEMPVLQKHIRGFMRTVETIS